jgi:dimethylglycine catabolism A
MYKPPERIRHALPPARAPSREEALASRLFSPLVLRSGLTLATRTWVPAMVPWRATEDGFVTDEVLGWYERFAVGRPGAIVVEATGIRDVPSGPLLRIGHDRFVPGLAELARRVRRASGGTTRLFIQLIDFLRIRRRPPRARFFREFLALGPEHRARLASLEGVPWHDAPDDAVRRHLEGLDAAGLSAVLDARELEALERGARERVWDTHLPHVQELPKVLPGLFAAAAERARVAGFDGVELHFAHAYTMASFMSALNDRGDGYGRTLEGRIRLPLEVLAAVRGASRGLTIGCRMLCDEIVKGGSGVDDASWFAVRLAAAGIDFVSLSTGGKFEDAKPPRVGEAAYPYTGRSGFECMPTTISDARGPFGRNVSKQAAVRRAIREAGHATPVVVCGGINHFDQAEGHLARGEADVIGAARQTLADPDWFEKIRLGEGDSVRRCLYSNYCEALDQKHKQVTCQLWDREDLAHAARTHDGKRRLTAPPWDRLRRKG